MGGKGCLIVVSSFRFGIQDLEFGISLLIDSRNRKPVTGNQKSQILNPKF